MLTEELRKFSLEDSLFDCIGIASANPFQEEDIIRMRKCKRVFRDKTLIVQDDEVFQPEDMLPGAKSIIILGRNSYFGKRDLSFERAKAELRGDLGELVCNRNFMNNGMMKNQKVIEFLEERGFKACSLSAGMFPLKLKAHEAGVGRYGKNTLIQNELLGSYISLSGILTDAELQPAQPIKNDCKGCSLCIDACPAGALSEYECEVEKCLDFNICHNKKSIPEEILTKTKHYLGENCPVCREVCPSNTELVSVAGKLPFDEAFPRLLPLLRISDSEWEEHYEPTLYGFFITEKRYLQRNAIIALGNLKNPEAIRPLEEIMLSGDEELKRYAAWSLHRISNP
jgi:epoxyqueuosine reductase